jgi:microcystin-dependent protein
MASSRQGSFSSYGGSDGGAFQAANGAVLLATQSPNQALYSLIGNTYGSTYPSFSLPDLRGRVVVGTGAIAGKFNSRVFTLGQSSGVSSTSLSSLQMPAHSHVLQSYGGAAKIAGAIGSLNALTTLSGLSATTSLSGVSASAALNGVSVSVPSTSLSLNGASAGTTSNNPSGKALGSNFGIYSSASPSIAMSAGNIGGTISGTLSGNAAVALSGNPATTVQGGVQTYLSGAPVAAISGSTDMAGAGAAIPLMPPYIVLTYYVAVEGLYPTFD